MHDKRGSAIRGAVDKDSLRLINVTRERWISGIVEVMLVVYCTLHTIHTDMYEAVNCAAPPPTRSESTPPCHIHIYNNKYNLFSLIVHRFKNKKYK